MWTNISKPSGTSYTNIAKPVPGVLIRAGMATGLICPPTYATNRSLNNPWINISKPTTSWTNISKPT